MNKAATASGNPALTPTAIGRKGKKPIDKYRLGAKHVAEVLKGEEQETNIGFRKISEILKGGPGSGNHGHSGRPGEVGGSGPGGGGKGKEKKPKEKPASSKAPSAGKKPEKTPEKKPSASNRDEKGRFKANAKKVQAAAEKTVQHIKDIKTIADGSNGKTGAKAAREAAQTIKTGAELIGNESLAGKAERIKSSLNSGPGLKEAVGNLGELAVELLRHAKEIVRG